MIILFVAIKLCVVIKKSFQIKRLGLKGRYAVAIVHVRSYLHKYI